MHQARPAAGQIIKLKIEDHADGTHGVEANVKTTVANKWETLTFDFNTPATGTPGLNAAYTYDKASLFFNFGISGTGQAYYTSASNAITYNINFGDGTKKIVSSGIITYKYNNPGTFDYTIIVNAVGTGGTTSTISKKGYGICGLYYSRSNCIRLNRRRIAYLDDRP